jgi:enterochelin esterase-like enzyme
VTVGRVRPGRGTLAATTTWQRLVMAAAGMVFAALAAAGAMGAVHYVSTFVLYRGFPPPSAPSSVVVSGPGGSRQVPVVMPAVQSIAVRSPALGGYADQVYVVLPPGYAASPARRYPVLYLLHGVPGQPVQFLNVGQVATTEATLVAAGQMQPMILVMPAGGRSLLADTEWADGVSQGNAWETFIARDLVAAIDARYRTISGASGRGIAGLSEGGYGALNIGLHHPGEFGLMESWSGYMMADNIPAVFGHDPAVLAYNSPARQLLSVANQLRVSRSYIWFYCGTRDWLAAQNRAFAAELTRLGIGHRFFEVPGTHNWALWRGQMSQALMTASEHLSHA